MNRFIAVTCSTLLTLTVYANQFPPIHQHAPSPLTFALRTGVDINGAPLYLCRANLFHSIQPGKTWSGYDRCNVTYGGKEYIVSEFTIPSAHEFGHYTWKHGMDGARVIGKDTHGNPLFLCQANFNGSIQPGKTWPGYNHCNISFDGREIITDNYKILANPREIIVRSRPAVTIHQHRSQQPVIHSHY